MPFVRQRQAEKRRYQSYGSANHCEVHVYHHCTTEEPTSATKKVVLVDNDGKPVTTATLKKVQPDKKAPRMPSQSLIPDEIKGFGEEANSKKRKSDYKGPHPEKDELFFASGDKALFKMEISD